MSEAHIAPIIGINWGSSNLRAYLIDAEGQVRDSHESSAGVTTLQRDGMSAIASTLRTRWPDASRAYASGMIGSNIGWLDAGYVDCPADLEAISTRLVETRIGDLPVRIVPGLACLREQDGAPDIMRGEETELFGLFASGQLGDAPVIALPGTHTKWVRLHEGRVGEFMTAMSGEIYDRLTAAGLLSSIVDGPGSDGPAFREGVRIGAARQFGLATALFGARARVIRGVLDRADAGAWLRGLLIGTEIADARTLFPETADASIPLVGSAPVCALYQAALDELGLRSRTVPSADAVTRGFVELDRMLRRSV